MRAISIHKVLLISQVPILVRAFLGSFSLRIVFWKHVHMLQHLRSQIFQKVLGIRRRHMIEKKINIACITRIR